MSVRSTILICCFEFQAESDVSKATINLSCNDADVSKSTLNATFESASTSIVVVTDVSQTPLNGTFNVDVDDDKVAGDKDAETSRGLDSTLDSKEMEAYSGNVTIKIDEVANTEGEGHTEKPVDASQEITASEQLESEDELKVSQAIAPPDLSIVPELSEESCSTAVEVSSQAEEESQADELPPKSDTDEAFSARAVEDGAGNDLPLAAVEPEASAKPEQSSQPEPSAEPKPEAAEESLPAAATDTRQFVSELVDAVNVSEVEQKSEIVEEVPHEVEPDVGSKPDVVDKPEIELSSGSAETQIEELSPVAAEPLAVEDSQDVEKQPEAVSAVAVVVKPEEDQQLISSINSDPAVDRKSAEEKPEVVLEVEVAANEPVSDDSEPMDVDVDDQPEVVAAVTEPEENPCPSEAHAEPVRHEAIKVAEVKEEQVSNVVAVEEEAAPAIVGDPVSASEGGIEEQPLVTVPSIPDLIVEAVEEKPEVVEASLDPVSGNKTLESEEDSAEPMDVDVSVACEAGNEAALGGQTQVGKLIDLSFNTSMSEKCEDVSEQSKPEGKASHQDQVAAEPEVDAIGAKQQIIDVVAESVLTPTLTKSGARKVFNLDQCGSTPQDVPLIPRVRPATPTKRDVAANDAAPESIKRHLFDSPTCKPTAIVRPCKDEIATVAPAAAVTAQQGTAAPQLPLGIESDKSATVEAVIVSAPIVAPAVDNEKNLDEEKLPVPSLGYNVDVHDFEVFSPKNNRSKCSLAVAAAAAEEKEDDGAKAVEAALPAAVAVAPFSSSTADAMEKGAEEEEESLPVRPAAGYNLDYLDDPNFNPFVTKSSGIRESFGFSQSAATPSDEATDEPQKEEVARPPPVSVGKRTKPAPAKPAPAQGSADGSSDAPPKEEKKRKPLPPKPWLKKKASAAKAPQNEEEAVVIFMPDKKSTDKSDEAVEVTKQEDQVLPVPPSPAKPSAAPPASLPSPAKPSEVAPAVSSPPLKRNPAPKSGYSIDFDDPDFNPFESKSKVANNFGGEAQPDQDPDFNPFQTKSKVSNDFLDRLDDPNFDPFATKSKVSNDNGVIPAQKLEPVAVEPTADEPPPLEVIPEIRLPMTDQTNGMTASGWIF